MDKKKCQPFSLRLRFKAEFDPNWDWEIDYTVNNCYNFHMNIHLEFFSSFGVKFDRTRKNNFEMGVKYLSLIWINNHCNNKKQCKLRRLLDKLSRCRFYQFWRILILKVLFYRRTYESKRHDNENTEILVALVKLLSFMSTLITFSFCLLFCVTSKV